MIKDKNTLKTDCANTILLTVLSFLLPLFLILIALIDLQITPFGEHTLMISDAKFLYAEYLSYSGRLVKGLEGFTYSFEKGLGGNMMPHIGGTMLNPFFPLISAFNISDYPVAFSFISVFNFCLCGLTMYILLADLYGHKRSNLIFSTSYALSGFLVANVFQIIFFTGCHALPVMVLGLRKIFQGKSPLLYVLAIIYATVTSFYFGFSLCIASALFFFVFLWLKKDDLTGKKLSIFLHYGISSLCAGIIPIAVWLPGYMGMVGGRANQTKITDFSFWEKVPFTEIFSKFFTGANTTSQLVNGLPNIFVGLLPVVLVILFFMNKKVTRRMKTSAGILIGFYMLGFYIIAFDMLLHGGTTTNWFNFRYSYIFSFILLMIAAYEWQYIDEITFKDLKCCFVGLILAILIVFSKKYDYVMGSEVLLDIGLLLVIFLAFRLYKNKPEFNPKHTFEAVTIFIVCISLTLNYLISTKNIQNWEMNEKEFTQAVTSVDPLITAIKKVDPDFYRMEVNHQLSETCGNDPMLYGYNGVGHGGSNERNFVREELFKLGVPWFNMRNYYSQGVPAATDTLLGIRYLIADEDMTKEKDYQRITDMRSLGLDFGDEVVYDSFKNSYSLPIGFVADSAVNELELTNEDVFDNLNRVWSSISGDDTPVFIEEDDISFKTLNLSASAELDASEARQIIRDATEQSKKNDSDPSSSFDTSGHFNSVSSSEGTTVEDDSSDSSKSSSDNVINYNLIMDEVPTFASSVEFSFTAAQDGPVYVYHRGAFMQGNGSAESLIHYMGCFHKGDTVKGYLTVTSDYVNKIVFEEYAGRFRAAYADLGALESLSEIITARPSTIEKIKDNHLKGTITLEEGQELLFTIPWDTGWTCYVDGEATELTKVLGVFMAAEAAPGEHTYEMKYVPGGLNLGIKISIAALIVLICYLLFGRKLINKIEFKRKTIGNIDDELPQKSETIQSIDNLEEGILHDPV